MQAGTCEHAFGGDRRRAGREAPEHLRVGAARQQTDPLGNQVTYTYDANGNKTTQCNPSSVRVVSAA